MNVTDHGEGRVRKRIGISKRNVTLTSTLAWNEGLDQTHFRGSFLRYLNAIYRKSPSGTKLKGYERCSIERHDASKWLPNERL